METRSDSDASSKCGSCPVVFWQVSFALALALAGAFILISCCLLGGSYYKEQAKKDTENFSLVLRHQAKLWKEEGDRRLEEQRLKTLAWSENEKLREDNDDLMEENKVLRGEKNDLSDRNKQLRQENERLEMENENLDIKNEYLGIKNTAPAGVQQLGQSLDYGFVEGQEEDSDVTHRSFPSSWTDSDSELGTAERTVLPPSPVSTLGENTGVDLTALMTPMGPLGGAKAVNQRKTWAADSPQSPSPEAALPEEDKWKPVEPEKQRASF